MAEVCTLSALLVTSAAAADIKGTHIKRLWRLSHTVLQTTSQYILTIYLFLSLSSPTFYGSAIPNWWNTPLTPVVELKARYLNIDTILIIHFFMNYNHRD